MITASQLVADVSIVPVTFHIHQPTFPLNLAVEKIIFYEGYSPPHHKERLLPDGGIDLVIDLTQVPKNLYNNEDFGRYTSFKKSWISGIRREFITIDAGQNSSMMVVRFRAGTASFLFKFPLHELADSVVEMDAIWGSDFLHLREHLLEQPTPEAKISTLENWLLRHLRPESEPHPVVGYALGRIHQSPQLLTIADVQAKTGFSNKHFIHLFEKHVGTSPKTYLRTIKFQRVLAEIEKAKKIHWNDIVYSCGYYDQAHFIKEFRHFSGLNPTAYLAERGEYLNYIPVKG
ncbi:MAG: helix-turn-helix domain-containing protein [Saprospiraceae bacterium]